jgi:hypothetical protein
MIDQGEAPHDETQLVHRDLLEMPSDVLTDMIRRALAAYMRLKHGKSKRSFLGKSLRP